MQLGKTMQSQSTGSPCAPMTRALARRKSDEAKVTGLPAADKIQTIMMQLRTKKCQRLPVNSQKRPKSRQGLPSSSRIKSSLKTYYILLSSPALATMRHCSALFQRTGHYRSTKISHVKTNSNPQNLLYHDLFYLLFSHIFSYMPTAVSPPSSPSS